MDDWKSRVWVQYAWARPLRQRLRRDDFRELPLIRGEFSEQSQPIGDLAWNQMRHTGLAFVEEPLYR
jgi:hypothetical protein